MEEETLNPGEVNQLHPKNRLFCSLDGLTPAERELKRVKVLKQLNLLETDTIPVFDEATQTAARFIETPICFLGLMVKDELLLKSAVGLSRLGLMNELAAFRKIPRQEAFCTYVVDSHQCLIIEDTLYHPVFASSILVQNYNIRAYLGTPLITSKGECIGSLAVMDLEPRRFTARDVEFLAITARWCLGEFERNYILATQLLTNNFLKEFAISSQNEILKNSNNGLETNPSNNSIDLQVKLLGKLTEKLRSPLTSVIGMANVILKEIYGSLTIKQKEYLKIIYHSGEEMKSLVDEMFTLGLLDEKNSKLQLTPVDVKMLCEQVILSLQSTAKAKKQELLLSLESKHRIWLLDKEKAKQALYFLLMSIIECSEPERELRIHTYRKNQTLNIAISVVKPGEKNEQEKVKIISGLTGNYTSSTCQTLQNSNHNHLREVSPVYLGEHNAVQWDLMTVLKQPEKLNKKLTDTNSCEFISLLYSCNLAEIHGGKIMISGSLNSGYRYVLKLPKILEAE